MHPEQTGARTLAQGHGMMLPTRAAQMHRIALPADRNQTPDLAIKVGGLLKIKDRKLNAAQTGDPRFGHDDLR
jgi:hypothetical protein